MTQSQTFTGRIARIRYQRGFFMIASVATGDTEILIKGELPGCYEGDTVTVVARKEVHTKWGEQHVVESCVREERSGIDAVLELLPNVGPARAKLIRETFGDANVFHVIEHEPHRLKEIPGITEDRIAAMRDVILERKAERDWLVWCGETGVSNYLASRIWDKFKHRSLAVLKETPYEILKCDGIGFLSADRIARRAGADADGLQRAKAAILYVLSEAEAAEGSTVVEAGMVMAACKGSDRGPGGKRTACQLSPPLPEEVFYEAIKQLRAEREIYMGGSDPVLIQHGLTRAIEKAGAEKLAAFVSRPSVRAPVPPPWYLDDRRHLMPKPELDDAMETGGWVG